MSSDVQLGIGNVVQTRSILMKGRVSETIAKGDHERPLQGRGVFVFRYPGLRPGLTESALQAASKNPMNGYRFAPRF
jgi:hypothetical protein